MNRRVIAAVIAVVLAGLGAVLVVSYVSGADRRAMAELEPVQVLVVAEPITQGTPAAELEELVAPEAIPATAVGPGAVTDLDELSGQVATTDLQPGEQVLASRFSDPDSLDADATVEVPENMHQVSILLEAKRALGGNLFPGATVGVFISTGDPSETHLTLHQVLVLRVQGGLTPPAPEGTDAQNGAAAPLPGGSVMVTLALSPEDAKKVVFASEYANIWLSHEGDKVPAGGPRPATGENLFR